jgi:hypothetical protein
VKVNVTVKVKVGLQKELILVLPKYHYFSTMSEGKESKEDYENEGKGAGGDEDDEQAVPVRNFDWMPEGCVPLADGEYDAIVMGTGLTECIISGLLSVQGNNNCCFSFSVESVMTIFRV